MFEWLQGRPADRRKASEIYGAVVAQARDPLFYSDLGVADTPVGRYEMIAMHLALVLERLGQPDVADEELRRSVVETFVTDMDDAMREMGIGDTSVPRNVKKAAGGLYERGLAYREALSGQGDGAGSDVADAAITGVLARYVYAAQPLPADDHRAMELAAYVRQVAAHLNGQPADALREGQVSFPAPLSSGGGA